MHRLPSAAVLALTLALSACATPPHDSPPAQRACAADCMNDKRQPAASHRAPLGSEAILQRSPNQLGIVVPSN
ncbi:MAG: hypothetical protein J0H72_26520 [Burkholderiales bacterium]|nr:hypothetical protein [Burkholderiales bacterium]